MNQIRLTIAPGDHFDFEVKPFERITCREYDRIHAPLPTDLSPLQEARELLMRYSGAPPRFVNVMRGEEVDAALAHIGKVTADLNERKSAYSKVHETLSKWAEEHDGAEFGVEDARQVLKDHDFHRTSITIEGQTFTAPDVEAASFGQWLDLQSQMLVSTSECDSYVRALSAMMEGPDGKFPVQGEHETDHAYQERVNEYTVNRQRLFWECPWVDVAGIAAFFFSKSQRFAELCGHNMRSLNSLLSPKSRRARQVIPIDGEPMQS